VKVAKDKFEALFRKLLEQAAIETREPQDWREEKGGNDNTAY